MQTSSPTEESLLTPDKILGKNGNAIVQNLAVSRTVLGNRPHQQHYKRTLEATSKAMLLATFAASLPCKSVKKSQLGSHRKHFLGRIEGSATWQFGLTRVVSPWNTSTTIVTRFNGFYGFGQQKMKMCAAPCSGNKHATTHPASLISAWHRESAGSCSPTLTSQWMSALRSIRDPI